MKTLRKTAGFLSWVFAVVTGLHAEQVPPTLKAAFSECFSVGAAMPGRGITAGEEALLATQFTNLTTENCLKAKNVHPQEDRYAFEQGDYLVAMAAKHGLRVNGHTLVWSYVNPGWFFTDGGKPAAPAKVMQRLKDHIATVAGHYAGRIESWDVVNEALAEKGDELLRTSKWQALFGEEFIVQAFLAADKADPMAELFYNDYGIEIQPKRDKALKLVANLRAKGCRVDGIGIQGHWMLGSTPLEAIEESIVAFHNAGLKVAITELDLDVVPRKRGGADASRKDDGADDPYANGCPPELLKQQAEEYAALFRLFRKHSDKISRVTFWNLHDGRSWLNNWPRKRTNHPLLWDRHLQPKPAFDAVIAVANEPVSSRGPGGGGAH